MKALLKRDHIPYGSGNEDWDCMKPKTEASKALIEALKANKFTDAEQKTLRRGALPAQTVEVLNVYDQAEATHLYATPTPSQLVALVRGINFDGEQVEVVVAASDLSGMPGDTEFAKRLIEAAGKWKDEMDKAPSD
jgi:hypothetical protein